MSRMLRVVFAFAVVISVGAMFSVADAAEPDQKAPSSSKVDTENAKKNVLAWIDDYREKQVLFHDKDIERLRKELADDTPEEAMKWWSKSAEVRAALESDRWHETREWLREFLRVQAIYSDEQVAEFQTEAKVAAKKESSQDFMDILTDVEKRRARLKGQSANAKAAREDKLKVVEAFRQEEAATRLAADRARARASRFDSVNRTPTAPTGPRAPRYSRPPLVDSLDAARWGVMRGFWGR